MKIIIQSVIAGLSMVALNVQAATLIVTSTADSGAGSLRAALASAANGDTIDAAGVSGTILLTSGELLVTKNLTILGSGPNNLAVDGNAASHVFHIAPSNVVSISSLAITHGRAIAANPFPPYSAGQGGGIYNDHASLTLSNCVLSANSAGDGGAIFNDGISPGADATLAIFNSTLSGNSAGVSGAIESIGVYAGATLTIVNSTISSNSASNPFGGLAGAIYSQGTLTIADSTLSGNSVAVSSSTGTGAVVGGAIEVFSGTATLTNCTLIGNSSQGNTWSSARGGAVYNSATLTIANCTLGANSATEAGGIYNSGMLTMVNSTVSGNSATYNGGGIYNDHTTLTVSNCIVSGNSAMSGGGIHNDGSDFSSVPVRGALLTVVNSTISSNSAYWGGGIRNEAGYGTSMVAVASSTLSGNSANYGGGVYNDGSTASGYPVGNATVSIANSTFSGNTAQGVGGIWTIGGNHSDPPAATLRIASTTFADNSAMFGAGAVQNQNSILEIGNTILKGGACGSGMAVTAGPFTSLGHNLSSDNGGGFLTNTTDQVNTDPLLGPLQDNGGPTFTHALLPGSPAINKGNRGAIPALASDTDQRGSTRPVGNPAVSGGDGSDIGAVETQSVLPAVLSVSPCVELNSSGNQGGPFSPSSQTYTLYNPGSGSIVWTASKSAVWLKVSATNGTLAPGESTTVIVSLAGNASSLSPGIYSDTVNFANIVDGAGSTARGVTLRVTLPAITVTSTADSGPGTLREALANPNLVAGGTIDASGVSGTITLIGGQLFVRKSLSIVGPGSDSLAVDGNNASRVFAILPGIIVTISGLTVAHGSDAYYGGGILSDGATLTVSNCTLNGSSAQYGGGIYNGGTLKIADSTTRGNFATYGGGIFNSGTLVVANIAIVNNSAQYGGGLYSGGLLTTIAGTTTSGNSAQYGGGIYNNRTTMSLNNSSVKGNSATNGGGIYNDGAYSYATLGVTNSTLSGNSATDSGGGIYSDGTQDGFATLTIANSTLSGNLAGTTGGGIYNNGDYNLDYGNADLAIANSTLSGNSAANGGSIFNSAADGSATVEIGNTILNTGTLGSNFFNSFGTVTSLGYNLSSDDGGSFLTSPGDQINTDPMLGLLQDNGGPTFTHALLPGSPAIDQGKNFSGSATDQRGPDFARTFDDHSIPNAPGGDGTDIGAFEVQPHLPPVAVCTNVTVSAGSNCSANASIDGGSYDPDSGDTITLTQTPPGPYPLGTNTVTLWVTDDHGASNSCTATVTVVGAPPVITATGTTLALGCNPTAAQISAALGTATAADNCSPVTLTATTGSVVTNGCTRSQTRTWNAIDAAGNPAIPVSRTVTWNSDTTAPTITVEDALGNTIPCGGVKVVSNSGQCSSALVPLVITANDTCSGSITPVCTRSDGKSLASAYPVGETVVTCSATDACGNTGTCVFTVLVSQDYTNASNFNGTSIAGGNYLWFNAVLKASGLNAVSGPVTIKFIHQQIISSKFSLAVPDTTVIFDSSVTCARTVFTNGGWVIKAPKSGLSGNTFLSGLAYQVPSAGLPGGIDPVSWSGTFVTGTAGVSLNWQWEAAVYTGFTTDLNALAAGGGVKATDDTKGDCTTHNSDHAGTPEAYKSMVVGGARGGGGSNWTGGLSGTLGVSPCATLTTLPKLNIQLVNGNIELEWDQGVLQQANQHTGPYIDVPNATNPYTVPPTNACKMFRVRME